MLGGYKVIAGEGFCTSSAEACCNSVVQALEELCGRGSRGCPLERTPEGVFWWSGGVVGHGGAGEPQHFIRGRVTRQRGQVLEGLCGPGGRGWPLEVPRSHLARDLLEMRYH